MFSFPQVDAKCEGLGQVDAHQCPLTGLIFICIFIGEMRNAGWVLNENCSSFSAE